MSDNGDGKKLIVKAELKDKAIAVTFGDDIPPLLYDRAIRLINLQMDDMIIASTQPQKVVKVNTPLIIPNISGMLKGKRI